MQIEIIALRYLKCLVIKMIYGVELEKN
jgi:hypothetical protein